MEFLGKFDDIFIAAKKASRIGQSFCNSFTYSKSLDIISR
jgi:hypothetical protein